MSRDRYPTEHDAERAAWAPVVARGIVACRRGDACLMPELLIQPGQAWDLGHPDAACRAPKAPEHRRCNRSTATHKVAAARRPAEPHPGRLKPLPPGGTPSPTPPGKGLRE